MVSSTLREKTRKKKKKNRVKRMKDLTEGDDIGIILKRLIAKQYQ